MSITPSGHERLVDPADLFFSTADRRGVIDGSNTVFTKYARIPMQELLGAPHNIVRHPDMPGGLFHTMWDLLYSGYPMAGYIDNLAPDGATYWVFATVTPLGDGFLSVRQKPFREDLFEAAKALYPQVLPLEAAARNTGASRRDAAALGAKALTEGVSALGMSDYKDFIRYVVPAEVTARSQLVTWTEPDPRDPGHGVTQRLIDSAIAVDRALSSRLTGLNELETLSSQLAETAAQAKVSLGLLQSSVSAAARASSSVADTQPVLSRIASALTEISQWLQEAIQYVGRRVADVRNRIAELRLRTALTRLHDEMLAEFAREMAAGEAPERAPVYVQQLCRALEEATDTATAEAVSTNAGLRQLAEDLGVVEEEMRDFQKQLSTWRLLIPRYQLSRQMDQYTTPIDAQLNSGLRLISSIRQLASQCLSNSLPFDSGPLADAVAEVVEARLAAEQEFGQQASGSLLPPSSASSSHRFR